MAKSRLWEFITEIRSDRKISQTELLEAAKRYDEAMEACRIDATTQCKEEKLTSEFLFMSTFERMMKPYRVDGSEGFAHLCRLLDIVNTTRTNQGSKKFSISPEIAQFYGNSENSQKIRMVRLYDEEIKFRSENETPEENSVQVNTADTIEPKTYRRFEIISLPEYGRLPKEWKDMIAKSDEWKAYVTEEKPESKEALLRTVSYYREVLEQFSTLPESAQKTLEQSRQWREWLERRNDELNTVILRYREAFEAFEALPESGKQAFVKSEMAKELFGDREAPLMTIHRKTKILEEIRYQAEIASLLERIDPDLRKIISWKNDLLDYYLKKRDPNGLRALSHYAEAFSLYSQLPAEARLIISNSPDWNYFISNGEFEPAFRSVVARIEYLSATFTELSKLDPIRQMEIRKSLEWKRYVDAGEKDANHELPYLMLSNEERAKIERLAASKLWPLKYSRPNEPKPPQAVPPEPAVPAMELSAIKEDGGKYRQPNSYDPKTNGLCVYFPTNVATMDRLDEADMRAYLDSMSELLRKTKVLVIEGYADARGEPQANQLLSEKRASAIKAFVESYGRTHGMDFTVKVVSFGNMRATGDKSATNPEETLAIDRKAIVTPHSNNFLLAAAERTKSTDIYLIDGSGSMGAKLADNSSTRMGAIQKLQLNMNARFYRFGDTGSKYPLDLQKTDEGDLSDWSTPLLSALNTTIRQNPGTSITVVSDGQYNEELGLNLKMIEAAARKSGTRINIIGIGIPTDLREAFQQLARNTGGAYIIEHE